MKIAFTTKAQRHKEKNKNMINSSKLTRSFLSPPQLNWGLGMLTNAIFILLSGSASLPMYPFSVVLRRMNREPRQAPRRIKLELKIILKIDKTF